MTAAEIPRPLWRDRRFATYWFGQGVSQLGDRVSELALPLLAVTMLAATPGEVGVLTAAIWAPNLASVVIGAWVDRRPSKRRLLVVANLVQALAAASVPLAYASGHLSLPVVLAAALVLGTGGVLYQTSYPTFFARLVPRKDYVRANSLLSTTRSGSFIAGPAIGGALINTVTAPVAMLVDAGSFLVSAGAIASVRVDEKHGPDAGEARTHDGGDRLLRRAGQGLVFLSRHPYLRVSLACTTTLNFFSFVVAAVLIVFANRELGLDAAQIGLALGLGALGGLVGALAAPRLGRIIGTGRTVVVGAVLFSAPFAFVPLAGDGTAAKVALLAVVEGVSSVGVMLFDVNVNSVQTAVTPDHMRSRTAGAFATVNYGIRPLGALLGGFAATWVGVGPTLIAAAVGGCLSVVWLVRSPLLAVRSVADLEPVDVPGFAVLTPGHVGQDGGNAPEAPSR
ncbi:MAG: MFS transporter [Lapillicoccus sp.]